MKAGRSEQVTEEAGFAWSSNLIFGDEEDDSTSCSSSSLMSLTSTTPSEMKLKMTDSKSHITMMMLSEEEEEEEDNSKHLINKKRDINENKNINSNYCSNMNSVMTMSDSEESMMTEYEWLEVIKMVDVGIQTDHSCLEEDGMNMTENLGKWKEKIEFKDKEIMELCEALSEEINGQDEEMTQNQLEIVRNSIKEKDVEIADLYEKISQELMFRTNDDILPLKRMESRTSSSSSSLGVNTTKYNNNNYCNNKLYHHQTYSQKNLNLVRNLSRNSSKSTMQAQGSEILNNIQSQGSGSDIMFRSFNDNDIQTIPEVNNT